jgi:hypothetical protein
MYQPGDLAANRKPAKGEYNGQVAVPAGPGCPMGKYELAGLGLAVSGAG